MYFFELNKSGTENDFDLLSGSNSEKGARSDFDLFNGEQFGETKSVNEIKKDITGFYHPGPLGVNTK